MLPVIHDIFFMPVHDPVHANFQLHGLFLISIIVKFELGTWLVDIRQLLPGTLGRVLENDMRMNKSKNPKITFIAKLVRTLLNYYLLRLCMKY